MSISVGLEGVRADKRLLIVPAPFFLSPFVTAAIPRLFLALIAIALGVPAWRQGVAWRTLVPLDAVSIAAFLVAAYVSINALWAPDQGAGFAKAALLWGLILITIAAGTAITALDERQLRLAALGFAAGAALGAVYVLIEMLTDAGITRALMNTFPAFRPDKAKHFVIRYGYIRKISLSELNQNVTIVMLSLWPALSVLALIADRHQVRARTDRRHSAGACRRGDRVAHAPLAEGHSAIRRRELRCVLRHRRLRVEHLADLVHVRDRPADTLCFSCRARAARG